MKIKNLHLVKNIENFKSSLVKTNAKSIKVDKKESSSTKSKLPITKPKIADKPIKNKKKPKEKVALEETQQPEVTQSEETVFSDCYRVRSKGLTCLELVSTVRLPRYVFNPSYLKQSGTQGTKGFVIMEIMGGIDNTRKINAYLDILKAARDGLVDFYVDLLDENNKPLMTISLTEPRINAIDFGTFEMEREEVRTIKVEIDYQTLTIDNQSI